MAAEGRRGLGRGLSALMGESEAGAQPGAGGAREIPIELIAGNPDQPRTQFDEVELEELVQSVRARGVLQPILLRPAPGRAGEYQIVAGERRWRAAQRAGLKAVPAVVREVNDQETLELALIENLQRSDLNAMEEAAAYASLMGGHRYRTSGWKRCSRKCRPSSRLGVVGSPSTRDRQPRFLQQFSRR